MSSFSEAFVNSFGTGASIGTNAAADARRDRLAGELRKQQEGQRAEEKRLAVEIRANQEKRDNFNLFQRAMESPQEETQKAALMHFAPLAEKSPTEYGTFTNELTLRLGETKKLKSEQMALEAKKLEQAGLLQSAQLDYLKSQTGAKNAESDYYNRRGQPPFSSRTPTPAPDPSQPYFDATARNPELLPQLEKKYEGVNLTDKQYDDLATMRKLKAAQPAAPAAAAPGETEEWRETREVQGEDGSKTTYESKGKRPAGSKGPAGGAAPVLSADPLDSLLKGKDTKFLYEPFQEKKSELNELYQLRHNPGKKPSPEDQLEIQNKALALIQDKTTGLAAQVNRAAAYLAKGDKAKEAAFIAQGQQEIASYAKMFNLAPPGTGPVSPPNQGQPTTPAKPALLPAAEKLRTANAAEEEPRKRTPPVPSAQPAPSSLDQAREMVRKADEAEKAKTHALMVRGGEDAREVAKNIFWDTPKALLKDAASGAKTATAELTNFLDAQQIVKQRRDWRKVLEAQGVKNPSEAMIDEMILKQVQNPRR